MSKARRTKRPSRSRSANVVDRSESTDVMTQLEVAARHPRAALLGAAIGGLVPWFARTLAHEELPAAWASGGVSVALLMLAVVLGCACFSALTVYKFGKAAFGDSRKALGFVLALEGVMLLSSGMTSVLALLVLVGINAVANGSVLALAREATCRRRDADARRAATRARTRSERSDRSAGRVALPPQAAPVSAPAPVQAPAAESPFEVVTVIDMPVAPRRRPRPAQTFAHPQLAAPADDVVDAEYRMLLS